MKAPTLSRKKTYVEQFRLRQSLHKTSATFVKRIANSTIHKIKSKPQVTPSKSCLRSSSTLSSSNNNWCKPKKSISFTEYQQNPSPRHNCLNTISNPPHESSVENQLALLKKQILKDSLLDNNSTDKFAGMMEEYSSAFKLTDAERECLGFVEDFEDGDTVSTASTTTTHTLSLSGTVPPPNSERFTDLNNNFIENQPKPHFIDSDDEDDIPSSSNNKGTHESNNKTNNDDSTWSKLANAIPFRTWLGMDSNPDIMHAPEPLDNENIYHTLPDHNNYPPDSFNEDSNERESPSIATHKLLKTKLLSMLEKACTDVHKDDGKNSEQDCFKCQHRNMLRSLALNYIDEIKYICKDKRLSTNQRDEKIIDLYAVWTYHLAEQNTSLATAYNESVNSADKLKSVLSESRNSMRYHQKKLDIAKVRNDTLSDQLSSHEQTISKLRIQLEQESEQRRDINKKLEETKADVQSLTGLVKRLRDKGVWDIHGLPMGNETFQEIFNEDYYLHGSKVIGPKEFSQKRKEWRNEIEMLKTESETLKQIIATKDREIQRMKAATAKARTTV